jgi:hypothetical protein
MREAITLAYLGSFFIAVLFYIQNMQEDETQTPLASIGLSLWSFHYLRRAFEHQFLAKIGRKFPIDEMVGACIYYWLFTTWIMWELFKDGSKELVMSEPFFTVGFSMFVIGEIGNAVHHVLLSQLKSRDGMTKHSIPTVCCFQYLTMPHYSFELLTWLGWNVIFGKLVWGSLAFFVAGLVVLTLKARVRYLEYIHEFHDEYPKDKVNIIIPFIY